MHPVDPSNMVVVITGGTAGVGRATARRFAKAGARVGLIARDEAALGETVAELERLGAPAAAAAADTADASEVFRAARDIEERLGPVDVWINNAMATVFAPVSDVAPDEFRRVTEVCYLGTVHGTMAALDSMRKRDRGIVVQVGSALAYRGIPLQAAYCGAKHAVRGFTDSVRTEMLYQGSNIKLIMVQLPAVNTTQFDWARTHMRRKPRPVPPVTDPAAIAETVYRATFSGSREVWVGASSLKVILGNMVAPGFLDRYLARNAYEAQSRKEPVEETRRDNLYEPVPGGHRATGAFAEESRASVIALSSFAATALTILLGAGLAASAGALIARSTGQRGRLPQKYSETWRHDT
jgi:short-subunit dehydrogenase